jgi:hypothetical protein
VQTAVDQFACGLSEYAALLGEVKSELIAASTAYKGMDREAIHTHAAAQTVLGERIRVFRTYLQDAAGKLPAFVLWPSRIVQLRAYIAKVEAEIRALNTSNEVLLKGSARTLRIFSNALMGLSPTYTNPVRQRFPRSESAE